MSPCPLLAVGALMLAPAPPQDPPAADPGAPPPFELADHAALTAALVRLATEYPGLASPVDIATSRGGRAIGALRLAGGEPRPGRPALLLVAGLEGSRVFESGLALHCAERLCAEYGQVDEVTALLDSLTVYVLPRADVDGAEARFREPRTELEGTGHGVDNDRDGRLGEDPPADVDGDGLITLMRVPDPEGTWIEDPDEPRALIEADPLLGQRGRWKLTTEGRDLDGDERVAEDPELDAVFNRNFPAGWQEHSAAGGRFPTDEPGVLGLCDFVLAHGELVAVLSFGAQGNLVKIPERAGESSTRVPASGLMEGDAEIIEKLGEAYREATGNENEDSAESEGSFQRWSYEHRGLWTLNANPWAMPTVAPGGERASGDGQGTAGEEESGDGASRRSSGGRRAAPDRSSPRQSGAMRMGGGSPFTFRGRGPEPEPEADAGQVAPSMDGDAPGRLAWIDASGEAARFVNWTDFEHPELGPVQIGGFAPYALHEPPPAEWAGIADGHYAFLLGLAELPARLSAPRFTAEDLGGGLWQIEAELVNEGFLPLLSAAGRRARTPRPARVRLELPEGATLLAGSRQELIGNLDGEGGRRELEWLVCGAAPDELRLNIDSEHAGSLELTPEVK